MSKRWCSVNTADLGLDLPTTVASALAGRPIDGLERVNGGRNSRVFCVRVGERKFALKQYPSRQDDPRDRLGTEVMVLKLMERQGFPRVPRVVAVDRDLNFALLSWLDGQPVTQVGDADVDQACEFLAHVHALRSASEIPATSLAAEACLSGAEIERQLNMRLSQLQEPAATEYALSGFLREEYMPAAARILATAKAEADTTGLDFNVPLPQERRSLVPSDFGFHNSLRQPDGALAFFDFEYFGWDDPVKMTADVLLHPGTPLEPTRRARLRTGAERLYGTDPSFHARLAAFYPLFGLRWVLILLNEFHPLRWQRRRLAGLTEDWSLAKARQLSRARQLLANLDHPIHGEVRA
jgi:hypothetical protein